MFLVAESLMALGWGFSQVCWGLYLEQLGFNNAEIGQVMMAPALGMLAIGLPMAHLSNRLGRARVLQVAVLLSVCYWFLILSLHSLSFIWMLSFIGGAVQGAAWIVGGPMLVENSTEENRVQVFSANFATATGAGFLGWLLGGVLPEAFDPAARGISIFALKTTLLAGALLAGFALVPLLRLRPYQLEFKQEPVLKIMLDNRRLFSRLTSPNALIGIGAGAMVQFFPLYFKQQFHLSPLQIGPTLAVQQAITALASFASPLLTARMTRVKAVVVCQAASLPFLAAIAFIPVFPVALGAYYIRGALMNMAVPIWQSFAMDQTPPNARVALGAVNGIVWNAGWTVGPWVSGYLQQTSGYSSAFSLTLVLYGASCLLTMRLFGGAEKPEAAKVITASGV
jgi:MFS family permease